MSVLGASLPSPALLAAARVLVVGDAMLDRYWFGHVDRISPEAPVPVVRVTREENRVGGAANVAMNVKTLGAQCTLLTVVGDDAAGVICWKRKTSARAWALMRNCKPWSSCG
jgi:bifunctional ADP-heptose synthase (sugar kinase/adenylyltransferase)